MTGEHTWKRVLFDTNMVSRWMDGDSDFQAPLRALTRKLSKRKAAFYVSAVTIQELMIFARLGRADQKAHHFLTETFTTLAFDERAALEAARIGAAIPLARGAKQDARDLWHRDIAIPGTASVYEVDRDNGKWCGLSTLPGSRDLRDSRRAGCTLARRQARTSRIGKGHSAVSQCAGMRIHANSMNHR